MAANIELFNRLIAGIDVHTMVSVSVSVGWSGAGGCGETNGTGETLDEKTRRREDKNTPSERRASGD